MKGLLVLVALDAWILRIPMGAVYGAGGFNVAHFRLLDAVQPLPLPALHMGVLLATGLLALFMAFQGATRAGKAALLALYSYGWAMSRLDSYQHHYLLTLMMVCLLFFPRLRAAQCLPSLARVSGPGGGIGRGPADAAPDNAPGDAGISAWGYTLLVLTTAVVYAFAALGKIDSQWLGGHTLTRIADQSESPFRFIEQLSARTDFWRWVACTVIVVEVAITIGYIVAVTQDRHGTIGVRTVCFVAWVAVTVLQVNFEMMGLHIGWFSYYMLMLSSVAFAPRGWLTGLSTIVTWPVRWAADRAGLGKDAAGTAPACSPAVWLSLAGVVAIAAMVAAWSLDLPGTVGAGCVAAACIVILTAVAVLRRSHAQARRQLVAAGVSVAVM